MSNAVDFRLTVPLEKSEREDGWYITGVAAGTEPDLEGDILTQSCIEGFADQINEQPVPFRNWHNTNSITADMGEVTKAWIENGSRLGVEVKLDPDNPDAQYLWKKLDQKKQYGMSVEGGIQEYKYDTARVSKSGRPGRVIEKVFLREISATTKPVYTPSFGTVLKKAIDEAEANSIPQGDTTSMTDVPLENGAVAAETTNLTPESTAPVNDTVEETVEKAVTADTARDAKKLTKLVKMHHEMAELIADLGLDGETTPAADSNETVDTAKSTDEAKSDTDFASLVKSSIEEATATLRAEIESLKSMIPETQAPGVLISKSEAEEAAEALDEIRKAQPRTALRLALAARHGEQDKFGR